MKALINIKNNYIDNLLNIQKVGKTLKIITQNEGALRQVANFLSNDKLDFSITQRVFINLLKFYKTHDYQLNKDVIILASCVFSQLSRDRQNQLINTTNDLLVNIINKASFNFLMKVIKANNLFEKLLQNITDIELNSLYPTKLDVILNILQHKYDFLSKMDKLHIQTKVAIYSVINIYANCAGCSNIVELDKKLQLKNIMKSTDSYSMSEILFASLQEKKIDTFKWLLDLYAQCYESTDLLVIIKENHCLHYVVEFYDYEIFKEIISYIESSNLLNSEEMVQLLQSRNKEGHSIFSKAIQFSKIWFLNHYITLYKKELKNVCLEKQISYAPYFIKSMICLMAKENSDGTKEKLFPDVSNGDDEYSDNIISAQAEYFYYQNWIKKFLLRHCSEDEFSDLSSLAKTEKCTDILDVIAKYYNYNESILVNNITPIFIKELLPQFDVTKNAKCYHEALLIMLLSKQYQFAEFIIDEYSVDIRYSQNISLFALLFMNNDTIESFHTIISKYLYQIDENIKNEILFCVIFYGRLDVIQYLLNEQQDLLDSQYKSKLLIQTLSAHLIFDTADQIDIFNKLFDHHDFVLYILEEKSTLRRSLIYSVEICRPEIFEVIFDLYPNKVQKMNVLLNNNSDLSILYYIDDNHDEQQYVKIIEHIISTIGFEETMESLFFTENDQYVFKHILSYNYSDLFLYSFYLLEKYYDSMSSEVFNSNLELKNYFVNIFNNIDDLEESVDKILLYIVDHKMSKVKTKHIYLRCHKILSDIKEYHILEQQLEKDFAVESFGHNIADKNILLEDVDYAQNDQHSSEAHDIIGDIDR